MNRALWTLIVTVAYGVTAVVAPEAALEGVPVFVAAVVVPEGVAVCRRRGGRRTPRPFGRRLAA